MRQWVVGAILAVTAGEAVAVQCDTDCGRVAAFKYPCPSVRKPYRKCEGREPAVWSSCQTVKFASCEVWEKAVDAATPKLRPHLERRWNRHTWQHAEATGGADEYMATCVAAGVAVAAASGTELGGPWGGAVSGGLGTFVSWRICDQSKKWG